MTRTSGLGAAVLVALGCGGGKELSLHVRFGPDGRCTMSGDALGPNAVRGASEALISGLPEWKQAVSCAAINPQSMPAVRISLSEEIGAADKVYSIDNGSRTGEGRANLVLMGSDRRCSLGRLSATAGLLRLHQGSNQESDTVPVGEVSATVVCKFVGFGEMPGPIPPNERLAEVGAIFDVEYSITLVQASWAILLGQA